MLTTPQIKATIIFIAICIGASIGLFFWHWWAGFAPIAAIYLIEWGCSAWVNGDYYPPGVPEYKKKGVLLQECPEMPLANILITSISQWYVRDMIQCSYYENYSSLGTGTTAEIQSAYNNLISQYYEAKNDQTMKAYIGLMKKIKVLELNDAIIETNVAILKVWYSKSAATALRKLPPYYQYTEQSYLNDIKMQVTGEIAKGIEYERLCRQLQKMEGENVSEAKQTPEQKHKNLIRGLMDINKVEGIKYDINTMTVLEYAIAENRLHDYVESLKAQAKTHGRPN